MDSRLDNTPVCRLMPKSEMTLRAVSGILEKHHILKATDDRWCTPFGHWLFMESVMKGETEIYMVYSLSENRIYGFAAVTTGNEVHLFFDRHTNAEECCKLCIIEFKKEHPDVKELHGYIPWNNRGACIFAVRNGFRNDGESADHLFFKDGLQIKCTHFRKEI